MQDKLAELREVARWRNPGVLPVVSGDRFDTITNDDDRGSGENESSSRDIETGKNKPPHPEFMKEYLAKIEVLKTAINEIQNNVEKVKQLKRSAMEATSPESEKAEARIRSNMHQAISRKFKMVFQEYQSAQTEYKHEVKQKVARQVKIVFPEATQDEVKDIVDAGDMTSAMAIRSRISGGHEMLRNAVADLEDKHRDIRRLEENVAELHQMFVEVAAVVEHQGELLDQIEYSVNQAKEYTENAERELVTARKYQASAKKRMCWIIVCLLVLLVIILTPTLLVILQSY